jgi:hypothetical protein
VRFDTILLVFGKIVHDYLTIRSNLGALYVGFMGNLNCNVSADPGCFLRANLSDMISFQADHRILKAILPLSTVSFLCLYLFHALFFLLFTFYM